MMGHIRDQQQMGRLKRLMMALLLAAVMAGLEGCVVFRTAGKATGAVLKTTGKTINKAVDVVTP